MFCGNCGKEVAQGKSFCGTCGAPAPATDDQPTAPTQPVAPVPPDAPPLSLDLPDPPRRRAGLVALVVVLAVLIIAVAFVVALLLSRGDETEATTTTVPAATTTLAGGAQTTTSVPGGAGKLVDVSLTASSIEASSVLPDQGASTYATSNLTDLDPATCWAENEPGYGVGESVEYNWTGPVTISQVRIVPGYDKSAEGWDRWTSNGRVRTFDLVFSDGSTEPFAVADSRGAQTLVLGTQHTVTWVQFVITGYYEAAAGPHKAEDTSVSELHFWGTD